MIRRLVLALVFLTTVAVPVLALQPPSTGQSEFVPISQLPPTEQMPAAPFVIIAYALLWLIAMFYVWTIWRRVNSLEAEFRALQQRSGKERRP